MVLLCVYVYCFFFKQKTAYEMRISDWSSDVCSSDLVDIVRPPGPGFERGELALRVAHREVQASHPFPRERAKPAGIARLALRTEEIGRASCRERVCQYV